MMKYSIILSSSSHGGHYSLRRLACSSLCMWQLFSFSVFLATSLSLSLSGPLVSPLAQAYVHPSSHTSPAFSPQALLSSCSPPSLLLLFCSLLVPPCPSLSLLVPLYLLHHSRMISSSDPRTVKYLKRSFQVAKDAVAHGNHPFGSLLVILAEDNSGKKREEWRRGEVERSGEKRRSR